MRRNIPPKSIRPIDGIWHWKQCYFYPGEATEYMNRDVRKIGTITKVSKNNYGRVSYHVGEDYVFIEDIQKTVDPKGGCCP